MGITYGGKNIAEEGRRILYVQETPQYDDSTYPPTLLSVSRSLTTGTDATPLATPIFFTGSFAGDATYLTINNVSISQSISVASAVKAGTVPSASFGGYPYSASVVFTTASTDTNYAVNIICQDLRAWSVQDLSTTGFIIQSNSSFARPSSDVMWSTIPYTNS